MTDCPVYLNNMSMTNALGKEHDEVLQKLISGDTSGMKPYVTELNNKTFIAGQVSSKLPLIPKHLQHHQTRNNQLILSCLLSLESALDSLLEHHPKHRIGVVMGTSTSGIAEGEQALAQYLDNQAFPDSFDYSQIQMSSPAEFIADYLGIKGPAYAISTACSSSGKVFASARSLIENNVCDAVIVGGADSLCDMTLNGFNSLEAISDELSNPFSPHRKGINIGEGAAVFIMSRQPSAVQLLGVGESSDAHHISAPHPEGDGAARAMKQALLDANIDSQRVDYLNLHGTGTELNDVMESKAVSSVLSNATYCSSTKPLTGHTLGAAGATELALCWLLLEYQSKKLPKHVFDGVLDSELPALRLVDDNQTINNVTIAMSNSFAFGGNNVSVIIGRSE